MTQALVLIENGVATSTLRIGARPHVTLIREMESESPGQFARRVTRQIGHDLREMRRVHYFVGAGHGHDRLLSRYRIVRAILKVLPRDRGSFLTFFTESPGKNLSELFALVDEIRRDHGVINLRMKVLGERPRPLATATRRGVARTSIASGA